MIFLGRAACGDRNSMTASTVHMNDINDITLQRGAFDELYVNTKVTTTWDGQIPDEWDFDTRIHAGFNGDLFGGNVDYTAEIVSTILVKRRMKGTLQWQSYFEIPIESNEDFDFIRNDYLCRNGYEYEYCLVPTLNGVEGEYSSNHNISTIKSEFDGVFVIEKDMAYHSVINTSVEIARNFATSVVETKGRRRPIVFYNGDTNYREFSVEATFVQFDPDTCQFDFTRNDSFREQVDDFLTDKKAKILKSEDGYMALVSISDSPISHSVDDFKELVTTEFTAYETGDCDDVTDLYYNNIIDCDYDVNRSIQSRIYMG